MNRLRVLAWPAYRNERWNPYNALLYRHLAKLGVHVEEFTVPRLVRGRYDLWHIHWPERVMSYGRAISFFGELMFRVLVLVARRRGIPIVWTAHNLRNHDQRYPDREVEFMNWFVRHIDGCISLSRAGLELVRSRFPALNNVCTAVIRHGHYRDAYPTAVSQEDARKDLGIGPSHDVVLFIGQIRPYKGVEELVASFRSVRGEGVRLVIAGRIKASQLGDKLREEAAADARIILIDRFLEPEDIARLCSAADVVFLPYREVLNSGSALLALSYDRPVVVPDIGAMRELQNTVGERWVRTYQGKLDAQKITDALHWAKGQGCERDRPRLPEWEEIALQTLSFYREVKAKIDGQKLK